MQESQEDATRHRSRRGSRLLGALLCFALGLGFAASRAGQWVDGKWFDAQSRVLAQHFPQAETVGIVVVGIDDGDVRRFPEPIALWHAHLADFFHAARLGRASAVALDIALPERSFDALSPAYDRVLQRGLIEARRAAPVIVAQTLDQDGSLRGIHPKFSALLGPDALGAALFPIDGDGVVRRFDERLGEHGETIPTLAGQVARSLGHEARAGALDYSRGGRIHYVPFRQVVDLARREDADALQRLFSGRVVLLGSVLPLVDRLAQPVNLAAWEQASGPAPGVLAHAQTLRNLLGRGTVAPLPPTWSVIATLLAALVFLLRPRARTWIFWGCLMLAAIVGKALLFRQGHDIAFAGTLLAGSLAIAMTSLHDAWQKLRERHVLRQAFSPSVSPAVLKEILSGRLSPKLGGERRYVCLLFSDIRNFTTRSEAMSPEAAVALLNRYFETVVAIVHEGNGAVVNFMGDGIMAIFGAPQPLENPCQSAFAVAKAMQQGLAEFNRKIESEGIEPIEIGIGLHAGEVLVGNIGASNRNDYTAIGDAANVASRIEGLTKALGHSIVVSEAVATRLSADADALAPLGSQPIKGHTPVTVFGWGATADSKQGVA